MIKRMVRLYLFKKTWRKHNKHNDTIASNIYPIDKVKVGRSSYGPIEVHYWGAENEELVIGNYVSIAHGVKFLLGGNHRYDTFSTFPFKVKVLGNEKEAWSKGKIIIEDDVWIGTDAMILSGITIGKGAVVAARSVVTKNVPAYSIIGGNPAKVIKFRFEDKMIKRLENFNFLNLNKKIVEENVNDLYQPLTYEFLDKLEQ